MKLYVEEIIENELKKYAVDVITENIVVELKELVIGMVIKSVFDACFTEYFPDFPLDREKPEVLSYYYEKHLVGWDVVIGDMDTGSFDDGMDLFEVMSEAEAWVNENIAMIKSFVEKKVFKLFEDQDECNTLGL